ncbi:hypothetical protein ACFX2B_046363 [Malus domestica]
MRRLGDCEAEMEEMMKQNGRYDEARIEEFMKRSEGSMIKMVNHIAKQPTFLAISEEETRHQGQNRHITCNI